MKRFHFVLLAAVAVLGLAASGCVITSAQVFAHYDLPDPFTIDSSTNQFEKIDVDLNTIGDYSKHKDKLKHLSDAAFGGKFTNQAGPAGTIEVWMTKGVTNYTSIAQVQANAIQLWGPASIGAAPSVVQLKWDDSAKLFKTAGKQALIDEVKGDGVFTIYTFGTAGTYQIKVEHGSILLVLDAGV